MFWRNSHWPKNGNYKQAVRLSKALIIRLNSTQLSCVGSEVIIALNVAEAMRVSRGWVRGVRTHTCSSSRSLLHICIKQRRCGYHHYLQPEICIVWNLVSKLPHFMATTRCKGHKIWDFKYSDRAKVICLKCMETHLKFHPTSSSDPSLLFFPHTPLEAWPRKKWNVCMIT